MNFKFLLIFQLFLMTFFSSYASVFINGVKITDMKGQLFDASEVIFNEDGDIHIYVKGVMLVQENEKIKDTENRYYFSVNAPDINKLEWIFINGREFSFKPENSSDFKEITSFLKKGENTVALKLPEGKNKEKISVFIGKGTEIEGRFEITSVAEYNDKINAVKSFKFFTFNLENEK